MSGGGYLAGRWLREGSSWPAGVAGAVILVVTASSRRSGLRRLRPACAACGGVFAVMSLLWGWGIGGHRPDDYGWLGAAIVVAGVAVIFFRPRHA